MPLNVFRLPHSNDTGSEKLSGFDDIPNEIEPLYIDIAAPGPGSILLLQSLLIS